MRKNLLTTLALIALPALGAAQQVTDLAQLTVLPGWRTASGDHIAALQITLAPGWKTYWRAPGDAGIPPQFFLSGSSNIVSVTPHWPVPSVLDQSGMQSIGYYDSVVVPITITTDGSGGAITLSGDLQIGICEEICIPVRLHFDTELPMTGKRDTSITAALIDRPLTQTEADVGTVTCAVDPISDGLRVTTTMNIHNTGQPEVVVVETADANVWVSQADVTRNGDQLNATVDMVHNSGTGFALDRSGVRITVLGSTQTVDIHGCTAG